MFKSAYKPLYPVREGSSFPARKVLCVLAFCLVTYLSFGQGVVTGGANDGSSGISYLVDIKKILYKTLQTLLAVSAGGSLVVIFYDIFTGKTEGIQKFIIAFVGCAVGYVLMLVMSGIGGKGDTGNLFSLVKSAMTILLSSVAMVNMARMAAKMIRGEQGSFTKLYTVVIVSVIGLLLLEAIPSSGVVFTSSSK